MSSRVHKNVMVLKIKKQNAPRPSEHPPVRGEKMSKRLGGIKDCKYKTSSWHLNGFPDGNNIGSIFCCCFSHSACIGCQPPKTNLHGGQSRS